MSGFEHVYSCSELRELGIGPLMAMSNLTEGTNRKPRSRRFYRWLWGSLSLVLLLGIVRLGWLVVRQQQLIEQLQVRDFAVYPVSNFEWRWSVRIQEYLGTSFCRAVHLVERTKSSGRGQDLGLIAELERLGFSVFGGRPELIIEMRVDSDATEKGLYQLRELKNLTMLEISGKYFTDSSLAELQNQPNLRELYIFNAQITDSGLATLRQMPALRGVCLENAPLTDAGLTHLENLSQLTELWIAETQITHAGIARLKQKLPTTTIETIGFHRD